MQAKETTAREDVFRDLPVSAALRKMVLPAVTSQLIVLIYNMADTFFVGQTNNPYMVAGTSLILPLFNITTCLAGLAGVGDLIVTCTSMHSRNRRAGILIGQGKDPQTAMKEVGAVVEGYYAAKSAYELGKAKGIDMPITDAAYKVLYEGADVKDAVQALLSRQRKSESEDAGWQ